MNLDHQPDELDPDSPNYPGEGIVNERLRGIAEEKRAFRETDNGDYDDDDDDFYRVNSESEYEAGYSDGHIEGWIGGIEFNSIHARWKRWYQSKWRDVLFKYRAIRCRIDPHYSDIPF